MPIPFIFEVVDKGIPHIPHGTTILKAVLALLLVLLLKWYSSGASNTSERQMHGKVILITGGTSGIGASIALSLAQRGGQLILLTHQSASDIFLIDYIEDLRERSGNELIYAEHVDLSSLYSVRQFATRWIDNAPPRRLDMIILCAATLTPPGKPRALTREGLEENWMVNYLANFHLLSILSPAIRSQPPDRDVRILFATCSSYIASPPIGDGGDSLKAEDWSTKKAYARSKMALMAFGHAFQKHLDAYKRPDGLPMNARVVFVDPGYSRTPGMRRWLSRGTLWGLSLYLMFWQAAWIFLKSTDRAAQSFLYAAMEATLGRGSGGKLIKECREVDYARTDIRDEEAAKKLWEGSEKLIERVEREEAVRRALEKKEKEAQEKDGQRAQKDGKESQSAKETSEAVGSGIENKATKSRRQKKAK